MGFFTSSPFDADVEKATDGKVLEENWNLILDICDKVRGSTSNAKECLKSIVKRLNNSDPHIIMHAITLLDACVQNCGRYFHLEIASRDFESELKRLCTKCEPKISTKIKFLIKKWAENEFKDDSQLDLIPTFYNKLKADGFDFSSASDTPRTSQTLSKDPNVVQSEKEEEDIAKDLVTKTIGFFDAAIELSLKEQSSPKASTSGSAGTSLYPSTNLKDSSSEIKEPRKVRALYDFEAAEDNELTFKAGEIISILDDSDPNWWKGKNYRGEGLFPANFVSNDDFDDTEGANSSLKNEKKTVQFNDNVEVKQLEDEPAKTIVEINEVKLQRLLHLLHEADPNGTDDSHEMLRLEEEVNLMGPLIDAELERVDRKHAQLTQLSTDLVEALNLYHTLMKEQPQPFPGHHTLPKQSAPPHPAYHPGYGPPSHHMFNGPAGMPPHSFVQHPPPPHNVTAMGSYIPPPESIYGSIPPLNYPNMMTPGAPPPTPPIAAPGPPMQPMGPMPPNLSMLPPHLQQPPQPPGPLPHEYANKYALGH